jgi:hypothetical protein
MAEVIVDSVFSLKSTHTVSAAAALPEDDIPLADGLVVPDVTDGKRNPPLTESDVLKIIIVPRKTTGEKWRNSHGTPKIPPF